MNKQEDKHPNRPHLRPASADNASQSSEPVFHQDDQRPAIPLNDDQIAFYKERIEKGFYCSLEVREKIAAHLTNEVFQRPSK